MCSRITATSVPVGTASLSTRAHVAQQHDRPREDQRRDHERGDRIGGGEAVVRITTAAMTAVTDPMASPSTSR